MLCPCLKLLRPTLPDKDKNKLYFWAMEDNRYNIRIIDLTILESVYYPYAFEEYSSIVSTMLGLKHIFRSEDDILSAFKDNPDIQQEWERGHCRMGPIIAAYPHRFKRAGIIPKPGGKESEGAWGWFDLWSDYTVTPQDELFDFPCLQAPSHRFIGDG